MTTRLNGTEFTSLETRTFTPAFEGAQIRRDRLTQSIMARRHMRNSRRANRAF